VLFEVGAMTKDQAETSEVNAEDVEKKARKAELKAAEKAKKAAKAEKKAAKINEKTLRKIEKKMRKEAEALSEKPEKTLKPKKSKPQRSTSTSMSLGAKLQAVARLARSNLATGLLEHGLYAGQEQVLFLLDEHGPLALTEMAEKLDVRAPTITKTVTRMEAQSFLSRAVSRDDARSIIIALTPEGRRVMKIGRQIVKEAEAAMFSSLNNENHEGLSNTLNLVLSNIKNN
jgi:DNA-binding MarR family transcriptional regulator